MGNTVLDSTRLDSTINEHGISLHSHTNSTLLELFSITIETEHLPLVSYVTCAIVHVLLLYVCVS